MLTREKIAEEWYKKGKSELDNDNIFESFIYLWISWIITCKIYISNNGITIKDPTDSKIIEKWAENNSRIVFPAMQSNIQSLILLAKRTGSKKNNPIVDTGNQKLRGDFDFLSQNIINGLPPTSSREISKTFVSLLNKIRNNLFHGGKLYSDTEDRELLYAILPTFNQIVEGAISKLLSEN